MFYGAWWWGGEVAGLCPVPAAAGVQELRLEAGTNTHHVGEHTESVTLLPAKINHTESLSLTFATKATQIYRKKTPKGPIDSNEKKFYMFKT